MNRLTGDKPENCGVLSHHSNDKTNLLPTFQVHNLLTDTLPLSTVFIALQKLKKKTLKRVLLKIKKT